MSSTGNINTADGGKLYVVATPIGNRDDITIRALKILGSVDLVAAEDTRHTGRFLRFHNIKTSILSYHEHNERERTPHLVQKLRDGFSVALVSNAGTPSVSDPGYRLITEAAGADIPVVPVPGVSAAITALSVSGLPTDSFIFVGFPVKKRGKRLKQLEELANDKRTMIFYESPKRVIPLLDELYTVMGDRNCVLSREMTKIHEEFIRNRISQVIKILKKRPVVKGECTILVAGNEVADQVSIERMKIELATAMDEGGIQLSGIVKHLASQYGISRKIVYNEALKIKGLDGPPLEIEKK